MDTGGRAVVKEETPIVDSQAATSASPPMAMIARFGRVVEWIRNTTLFLTALLSLFIRRLLHGFGALMRVLRNDPLVRAVLLGTLAFIVIFRQQSRGYLGLGAFLSGYCTPWEWWKKLSPYVRIWTVVEVVLRTRKWLKTMSLLSLCGWTFLVGNVVIATLSVLLALCRLADDALGVSRRLKRIPTSIRNACSCCVYWFLYTGWTVMEKLLVWHVTSRQTSQPGRMRSKATGHLGRPLRQRRRKPSMRKEKRQDEDVNIVNEEEASPSTLERFLVAFQRTNLVRPREEIYVEAPEEEVNVVTPVVRETMVIEQRMEAIEASATADQKAASLWGVVQVPARMSEVSAAVVKPRRKESVAKSPEPYVLVVSRSESSPGRRTTCPRRVTGELSRIPCRNHQRMQREPTPSELKSRVEKPPDEDAFWTGKEGYFETTDAPEAVKDKEREAAASQHKETA